VINYSLLVKFTTAHITVLLMYVDDII